MWPSFETAVWLYDRANLLVIGALTIGVIATVLVVWMGNVKEEYLRRDLASTNERAANAEERAAEANLELARLKAPRTLTAEQKNRISERVRKFPGTIFDATTYPGEPEAVAFTNIISELLEAAGWTLNPRRGQSSLMGSASGMVVVIGKHAGAPAEMAGKELTAALAGEGVTVSLAHASLQVNPIKVAIQIQVARKP